MVKPPIPSIKIPNMASSSGGWIVLFLPLFLSICPSSQQGTDSLTTESPVTDQPVTNAPPDPPVVPTTQAAVPATAVPTDATELPQNTGKLKKMPD